MKSNVQYGFKKAFVEVAMQREVLSPADLVIQLSEVEARKRHLVRMLDWCREAISGPIDDDQHQMLMDFIYLQAAKKNIASEELQVELQFKYMVDDLRTLPIKDLWDAMTFVKAYS